MCTTSIEVLTLISILTSTLIITQSTKTYYQESILNFFGTIKSNDNNLYRYSNQNSLFNKSNSEPITCKSLNNVLINCETWLNDVVSYIETLTKMEAHAISILIGIIDENLKKPLEIKSFAELQQMFSVIKKLHKLLKEDGNYDKEMINATITSDINIQSGLINKTKSLTNLDSVQQRSFVENVLVNLRDFSMLYGCNSKNRAEKSNTWKSANIELNVSQFNANNEPRFAYKSGEQSFNIIEIESEVSVLSNTIKDCETMVMAAFLTDFDSFFNDSQTDYSANNDNFEVNSKIVLIDIPTNQIMTKNSELKVAVSFNHTTVLEFGDKSHCVYWDFSKNQWSTTGCQLISDMSSRDVSQCVCDQLSNVYALFLETTNREKHLSTIIIVSIIITMLFSFIVLIGVSGPIAIEKITTWNETEFDLKSIRDTVILNLCICLLLIDIIIATQLYRKSPVRHKNSPFERSIKCDTVSMFLLIFLLSILFWIFNLSSQTFIFGKNLKVNDTLIRFSCIELPYMYVSVLIGYLIPILIAIPVFFIYYFQEINYKATTEDYFCGVSMKAHIIILSVFFGLILTGAIIMGALPYCQRLPSHLEVMQKYKRKSLIFMSIFILLWFITWAFYLLYIHQLAMGLIYVFFIINALQAIWILVFQCKYLNKKLMFWRSD